MSKCSVERGLEVNADLKPVHTVPVVRPHRCVHLPAKTPSETEVVYRVRVTLVQAGQPVMTGYSL